MCPGMTHPLFFSGGPRTVLSAAASLTKALCRMLCLSATWVLSVSAAPLCPGTGHGLEPLLPGPLLGFAFPPVAGHLGIFCLQD